MKDSQQVSLEWVINPLSALQSSIPNNVPSLLKYEHFGILLQTVYLELLTIHNEKSKCTEYRLYTPSIKYPK